MRRFNTMTGWLRGLGGVLPFLVTLCLCATEPIRAPLPQPRMTFPDGDFVSGELKETNRAGVLQIQSPLFISPFEFPVEKVDKVEFPVEAAREKAHGEYCFELSGGDVFFGKLLKLSASELEVQSETLGQVKIQTSRLRRIARWDGVSELIYMGPNGLTGWTKLSENAPKDQGDTILLDLERTTIFANLGIPEKALIECEISWKGNSGRKPEFVLSLGVGQEDATIAQAFGLEVWEGEVVARRETKQEADVEKLADVSYGAGRLHLLIYLDQLGERMLIFSPDGKKLADLRAKGATPQAQPGIRLTNKKGEVRLERLRISRWVDNPVTEVQAEKPRLHQKNGEVLYGTPIGYDATSKAFRFRGEQKESTIPADQITNIHLPGRDAKPESVTPVPIKPEEKKSEAAKKSSTSPVRFVFRNGTRISGEVLRVKGGKVTLQGEGIAGETDAALDQLQSLSVLEQVGQSPLPVKKPLFFVGDGIRLRGDLTANGKKEQGASILCWSPQPGNAGIPFRTDAAGRVVTHEKGMSTSSDRSSPNAAAERGNVAVAAPAGGVIIRRVQPMPTTRSRPQGTYRPPSLYLRTGDTIPCRVTRIDEKGVSFESSVAKAKFIPHDKIKAVELIPRSGQPVTYSNPANRFGANSTNERPRLDVTKRDRLLTLPRMQRTNPPTHLIVATNKDILRGRIVSLDEAVLRVELRLDNREVPRERIGQIIWLHPDELEGKPPVSPAVDPKAHAARVHAIRTDGNRFTFIAEKLENQKLSGTNDVLGPCEVELGQLDELLLGKEIEHAATQLAYQQWKLHYAEEPLIAAADGEGGADRTGLESPLVGKPAPSFTLDLVKPGEKITLGNHLGKVVILDFWASWCGPCMQTMPQIHAVAEELRGEGVELVGVNLEEAPQQIRAALARLKLNMTVAMDREGKVGGQYGVTSIPKTIIIDREGKVARVYVGGHSGFANELRDALKAVLNNKSDAAPAKKP